MSIPASLLNALDTYGIGSDDDEDIHVKRRRLVIEELRKWNAAEIERLNAELAAVKGLLARCGNHIMDWHAKYGKHQPKWLPPANGALFIQAIDAALTDKDE